MVKTDRRDVLRCVALLRAPSHTRGLQRRMMDKSSAAQRRSEQEQCGLGTHGAVRVCRVVSATLMLAPTAKKCPPCAPDVTTLAMVDSSIESQLSIPH